MVKFVNQCVHCDSIILPNCWRGHSLETGACQCEYGNFVKKPCAQHTSVGKQTVCCTPRIHWGQSTCIRLKTVTITINDDDDDDDNNKDINND